MLVPSVPDLLALDDVLLHQDLHSVHLHDNQSENGPPSHTTEYLGAVRAKMIERAPDNPAATEGWVLSVTLPFAFALTNITWP